MIEAFRLRLLLVALAGWVNCQQLDVIEYLREGNLVCAGDAGAPGLTMHRTFPTNGR